MRGADPGKSGTRMGRPGSDRRRLPRPRGDPRIGRPRGRPPPGTEGRPSAGRQGARGDAPSPIQPPHRFDMPEDSANRFLPDAEHLLIMRSRVRVARAALVMLVLLGATSCTTKPEVMRSELNERVVDAPVLLRFETVRSILEDSKGNYWFGSWKEGVCRFDGKSLTYFTVDDGLSDNQIRSIHEDHNGIIWFECGLGITGFDGGRIFPPTSRNYTSKDKWQLRAGDLWFKEDGRVGATEIEGQPGVYRYDGTAFTYLNYPIPPDRARV